MVTASAVPQPPAPIMAIRELMVSSALSGAGRGSQDVLLEFRIDRARRLENALVQEAAVHGKGSELFFLVLHRGCYERAVEPCVSRSSERHVRPKSSLLAFKPETF